VTVGRSNVEGDRDDMGVVRNDVKNRRDDMQGGRDDLRAGRQAGRVCTAPAIFFKFDPRVFTAPLPTVRDEATPLHSALRAVREDLPALSEDWPGRRLSVRVDLSDVQALVWKLQALRLDVQAHSLDVQVGREARPPGIGAVKAPRARGPRAGAKMLRC